MTTEFSAASLRSPPATAGREGVAPMSRQLCWFLIGVVFAIAIGLRQVVPLNTDVSWLLVIGERMLDGQRLFRDIVEINPPMAPFAYLPGVALARLLGVDPRHVIDAQLLLLAAASLFAASRILRLSPVTAPSLSGAFAVWAAAIVTILPMHVFAQREHIALLTLLPALAAYALRSNGEPLPLWAILIAGVGTGITLAFKPFFVVPVALCILFVAIHSRSWRVLFAPENIIAGVIVTSVSVGTYVFYSEYFTITYPLVRDTYLSWSMPFSVFFLNDATLIAAIALVTVALARRKSRPDPALLVAVLASVGFAVSFYLQRRGWAYHSYPMVSIALLAMGYVLTGGAGARSRLFAVASILVMAATFAFGMLWFNIQIYLGPIKEAVVGLKPRPRILMLSGEAALGHPLVRDVGGVWVSRQENLWLRAFTRITREKTVVDAATDARLNGYLALERQWLIEDFKKLPPDIILVDNLRDQWGDWVRADAELTELFKPYALVRTVEGVDILKRKD
jgi:hypothetical protein